MNSISTLYDQVRDHKQRLEVGRKWVHENPAEAHLVFMYQSVIAQLAGDDAGYREWNSAALACLECLPPGSDQGKAAQYYGQVRRDLLTRVQRELTSGSGPHTWP